MLRGNAAGTQAGRQQRNPYSRSAGGARWNEAGRNQAAAAAAKQQ